MRSVRIASRTAAAVLSLALSTAAHAQAWPTPAPGPGKFPSSNPPPAAGPGQFPPADAPTAAAAPGQFPPAGSPQMLPQQPGTVPPPSQWGNPGGASTASQHPAWGGGGRPAGGGGGGGQAGGPPCSEEFLPLRSDAQTKGQAIKAAVDRKADRGEVCKVFRTFVAAEAKVVKFVVANGTRCSIPADAVKVMKTNHGKSVAMSNRVCNAASGPAAPAPPSLSDALGTSRIPDTSSAKGSTGGTFDTLSGSTLQR
jgi:hypothetical protein